MPTRRLRDDWIDSSRILPRQSKARIHREIAPQIPQSRSYRRTYGGSLMVRRNEPTRGHKQAVRIVRGNDRSSVNPNLLHRRPHATDPPPQRASERQLAQPDREGEERLLLPEKLRRLEDGVQVADRVLLLADRPLPVEVHDRGEDLVQGDAGLEGLTDRFLRGRRLVPQARLEGGEDRRAVRRLRLAEPQELGVAEPRREGSVQLPEEPRVFRRRQVATRDAGRVDLAQGVAEESGVRARRNQEGAIRLVGH